MTSSAAETCETAKAPCSSGRCKQSAAPVSTIGGVARCNSDAGEGYHAAIHENRAAVSSAAIPGRSAASRVAAVAPFAGYPALATGTGRAAVAAVASRSSSVRSATAFPGVAACAAPPAVAAVAAETANSCSASAESVTTAAGVCVILRK
jgi:hypothetical protein